LRRQGSELLPAAPQRLSLLRSELPPLLEALTCHRALLGTHLQPALAAAHQRLLASRRQRPPAGRERAEQPLLRGGGAGPGRGGGGGPAGRGGRGGGSRRRGRGG